MFQLLSFYLINKFAEPGPFERRTLELGTYLGVHQAGRLVAMAGQRFQVPGWCEISLVCAHPDVRRQGLGAGLTLLLAALIREQGNEVLLHVVDTNEHAISLYEKLGFRETGEDDSGEVHAVLDL